jgi:hypothetical protein
VTFNETASYPRDVIKCACDKEIEENIFVDEGLQGIDGDEDELSLLSTSSPEPVSAFTLEVKTPQATTSFTVDMEASWVEGEAIYEPRAPSHIQKAHRSQQIIGNLNKRVTCSSTSVHLACFTNTLFIALFKPRDVRYALSDSSWINIMHEGLENFERNQVWILVDPQEM